MRYPWWFTIVKQGQKWSISIPAWNEIYQMHTCKIKHWGSNRHSTMYWILFRAPQTANSSAKVPRDCPVLRIWSSMDRQAVGEPWSCLSNITIKTVEGFILAQFLNDFCIPQVNKPSKTNCNKNNIKYRRLNPKTIYNCCLKLSLAVSLYSLFEVKTKLAVSIKMTVIHQ